MEFAEWWFEIGSGIIPEHGEDYEMFARRVAELAFKSGRSEQDDREFICNKCGIRKDGEHVSECEF